jgi:hypothetical protein
LIAVRAAMSALAKRLKPEALQREAFSLYEQFRPKIPEGARGWGAKGTGVKVFRMRFAFQM